MLRKVAGPKLDRSGEARVTAMLTLLAQHGHSLHHCLHPSLHSTVTRVVGTRTDPHDEAAVHPDWRTDAGAQDARLLGGLAALRHAAGLPRGGEHQPVSLHGAAPGRRTEKRERDAAAAALRTHAPPPSSYPFARQPRHCRL